MRSDNYQKEGTKLVDDEASKRNPGVRIGAHFALPGHVATMQVQRVHFRFPFTYGHVQFYKYK